jgi:hypothetical protein
MDFGFDEKQKQDLNIRVTPAEPPEAKIQPQETVNAERQYIKILDTPAGSSPSLKKRLKLEVESLARLSHPAIVPILECGETPAGLPYVKSEYIDDPTLFDILQSKANLQRSVVFDYLVGVCEALAHAHANGVVLRKLTARDVFISELAAPGEQVKVSGFGTGWIGDARKADPQIDVHAFGLLMQEAFSQTLSASPEIKNIITFCSAEPAGCYSGCGEVLENLLLVKTGKMPMPPRNRAGQSLMKPQILVALVAVVAIVTAAICMQMHVFNPPAPPAAQPTVETTKATNPQDTATSPTSATTSLQPAPVAHHSIPPSLNISQPATVDMHKLSKSSITTGAATAVIGGAAVYQTLTPEQKRMAQQEALNGSKKVFQRWQNLSPETKQSFKQKAAGFAGKAKSLWSRLPSQ